MLKLPTFSKLEVFYLRNGISFSTTKNAPGDENKTSGTFSLGLLSPGTVVTTGNGVFKVGYCTNVKKKNSNTVSNFIT